MDGRPLACLVLGQAQPLRRPTPGGGGGGLAARRLGPAPLHPRLPLPPRSRFPPLRLRLLLGPEGGQRAGRRGPGPRGGLRHPRGRRGRLTAAPLPRTRAHARPGPPLPPPTSGGREFERSARKNCDRGRDASAAEPQLSPRRMVGGAVGPEIRVRSPVVSPLGDPGGPSHANYTWRFSFRLGGARGLRPGDKQNPRSTKFPEAPLEAVNSGPPSPEPDRTRPPLPHPPPQAQRKFGRQEESQLEEAEAAAPEGTPGPGRPTAGRGGARGRPADRDRPGPCPGPGPRPGEGRLSPPPAPRGARSLRLVARRRRDIGVSGHRRRWASRTGRI